MIRLYMLAEGPTEENFAREVLVPHLAQFDVYATPKSIMTGRDKRLGKVFKGGLITFGKFRKEMLAWMKEDRHAECRFTTMLDFYALPKDFPGFEESCMQRDPYERIRIIEDAMANVFGDNRFIPYIQLHEFEALVFANPQKLELIYLDYSSGISNLVSLAEDQEPELIDDGRETSPSKRIMHEIPAYNKAFAGPEIVREIGLPVLRQRCPHFGQWLSKLEELAGINP